MKCLDDCEERSPGNGCLDTVVIGCLLRIVSDWMVRDWMGNDWIVKDWMVNDWIVSDWIGHDLTHHHHHHHHGRLVNDGGISTITTCHQPITFIGSY